MKPLWITAYDANFEEMYLRHFIRSFNKLNLDQEFDLEVHRLDWQYGTYGETQYKSSYRKELDNIIGIVEANLGRVIVWTDVDIHMYRNPFSEIEKHLADCEVACQMDSDTVYCTGFQFFVASPAIVRFLRDWAALDDSSTEWSSGQESFNVQILKSELRWKKLPIEYWTVGLSGKKEVWDGVSVLSLPAPPKEIILHHGNFTVGRDRKILMMDVIQRDVERK